MLGVIISNSNSLAFAEGYHTEDDHLVSARDIAVDLGLACLTPAAASTLAFLASAIGAKNIAEIGTGSGVSGLYLLRAMVADGVLTSVDPEAEHQRHARRVFMDAGFTPTRFRLINGWPLEVLPRLIDGGYDLVYVDGDKVEYGDYLAEASRLTRDGGLIVFDNALWHNKVADPSQRDPQTTAIRELLSQVAEDPRLRSVLLPTGDGLLAVQKMASA